MAKKTTTESGQEPTGKEIRVPADGTIKAFNSAFNEAHETIDGANEELKDAADIAKKKHLDIWAFKIMKGLYDKYGDGEAKNSNTLAIKLTHLEKCRKYFKLDELANLQGRLFGEGEIGGGDKGSGEPPRETDEDGEPDLRPTHLRQPGASAASAVQDLAAKSGAKTQASNVSPIDQVGRGKTQDPKLN